MYSVVYSQLLADIDLILKNMHVIYETDIELITADTGSLYMIFPHGQQCESNAYQVTLQCLYSYIRFFVTMENHF